MNLTPAWPICSYLLWQSRLFNLVILTFQEVFCLYDHRLWMQPKPDLSVYDYVKQAHLTWINLNQVWFRSEHLCPWVPFLKLRYLTNLVESYRTSLRHWSAPSSLHSGFLCVDLNVQHQNPELNINMELKSPLLISAFADWTLWAFCWLKVQCEPKRKPFWIGQDPPHPFRVFFRTAPLTNVCFFLA